MFNFIFSVLGGFWLFVVELCLFLCFVGLMGSGKSWSRLEGMSMGHMCGLEASNWVGNFSGE